VAQFELIIGMLLLGALLTGIARALKIAYPILLAILGIGLAFVPNLPALTLDPEVALALFVAPILLDAAYDASLRDLRDNWRAVANLALVAIVLTVIAVAVVARWLVPGMSWPVAIALGAIVAPPDASAATTVLRQLRPPHRILVILEGESLFNDASALLIYRAAVAVTVGGAFLGWGSLPLLLLAITASVLVGILAGRFLMRFVSNRIQEAPSAILTQFLSVFMLWILAEQSGLSGIITIVCFAITVAQLSPQQTSARLRIPSYAVWEVAVFVLNILAFILVGLQLRPLLEKLERGEWASYLAFGGAVCATTILARIAWVMSYNTIVRWKNRHFGVRLPRPMMQPTVKSGIAISWCGMRGVVTLAAALALPDGSHGSPLFPHRDLILFAAFCVVVGTLVIQGLTLRPLMAALGLHEEDDVVEREVRLAKSATARAALRVLEERGESDAVVVLRREYEARLANVEQQENTETRPPELASAHRLAIAAERRALAAMRVQGEIGDDAFHRLEEELDWAEVHAVREP
jgi:monovalent cation/hydrogen antiporter